MKFIKQFVLVFTLWINTGVLLAGKSTSDGSKRQKITIIDENSFIEETTYNYTLKQDENYLISIPYNELETVSNIEANYLDRNDKTRDLKKENIYTQSLPSQVFYGGYMGYVLNYPNENYDLPIEYSYKKTSSDLMLLAHLSLMEGDFINQITYEIFVPTKFSLNYTIDGDTSILQDFKIDTTKVEGGYLYTISTSVIKTIDHLQKENIRYVSQAPGMRLLIIPNQHKGNGFSYLNGWCLDLIKSDSTLNEISILEIEQILNKENITDTIKELFNYVKQKISYIDIENGIGAFKPRKANSVLYNKKGDCKDMANLLKLALRKYGFESYYALSSTLNHSFDLDFPSIVSANHAICVVKNGDNWLCLDATESSGIYGLPSRFIQDRNIFIINNSGGVIYTVPKVNSRTNKVSYESKLKPSGEDLAGTFEYTFDGHSQIEFNYIKSTLSDKDYDLAIKNWFKGVGRKTTTDSITVEGVDSHLKVKGNIKTTSNFTAISNKTLLSLVFYHYQIPLWGKLKKMKSSFYHRLSMINLK